MEKKLKEDKSVVEDILRHTSEVASRYLSDRDNHPASRNIPDIELGMLSEEGLGAHATLDFFEQNYADKFAASAGPRYFAFVTGGSTPAAIAGDWMVSTLDQNACGSNDSMAPQLERQTIHYLKQLLGLSAEYFGSFVTGATMANFAGLTIGRQWVGEQMGVDVGQQGLLNVPIKIVSGTPHSTIIKSLAMSGIGRDAMIYADVMENREAVDLASLERILAKQTHPVIVVANAGTVNTVDFDDMEAIGTLKGKYNFWLHVDAAFGGFAACSEKYAHYVKGINHADSITVDAHKWLNVPYDAAMQFTKHKPLQLKVFRNSAAYLGDPDKSPDFFHYTPETSRRFRALPSWFTLTAYGETGHREIVERNCECAAYLGKLIEASTDFSLLAEVRMNVVCFTIKNDPVTFDTIQKFLAAIRDDGRIFLTPTMYKGKAAVRAAISNWQTELDHINLAMDALTEVWEKMKKSFLNVSPASSRN